MKEYATIKDIVESGLEKISPKLSVSVNLNDLMYIYRVLEEYMRFFHQPNHYTSLESVHEFLGDTTSGGAFEVLNTALYKKVYKIKLPIDIENMINESAFEHPLYPKYYSTEE